MDTAFLNARTREALSRIIGAASAAFISPEAISAAALSGTNALENNTLLHQERRGQPSLREEGDDREWLFFDEARESQEELNVRTARFGIRPPSPPLDDTPLRTAARKVVKGGDQAVAQFRACQSGTVACLAEADLPKLAFGYTVEGGRAVARPLQAVSRRVARIEELNRVASREMGYVRAPGPVEMVGGISGVVEYGQAFGRRALRWAGVSPSVAQDTMDVVPFVAPLGGAVGGPLRKAGARFQMVKPAFQGAGGVAERVRLLPAAEGAGGRAIGGSAFTSVSQPTASLARPVGELAVPRPLRGVQHPHVKEIGADNAGKNLARAGGRSGKQRRLKDLMVDDKLGAADRGWIKQELNRLKRKDRSYIRVPVGKELAHKRGFEASKGFDYSHSHLQEKNLHTLQHKYDAGGRKNKTPK